MVVRERLQRSMCGLFGYRSMWNHLRQNCGIYAPRDSVMAALQELDPEGVRSRSGRKLRQRKYQSDGPNSCWHVDGYEKLKPYGFPVHSCIDGFSRKIVWLRLVKSNNDPFVIAKLYLDDVGVRTDCGSENGILAASQCYF